MSCYRDPWIKKHRCAEMYAPKGSFFQRNMLLSCNRNLLISFVFVIYAPEIIGFWVAWWFVCLFISFPGVTKHWGCIFHSLIAGFSLLVFPGVLISQRRVTVGRTPLDVWSIRRRDLLPDNTQHSQQTNIHAPGGIRTHDLSRRAAEGRGSLKAIKRVNWSSRWGVSTKR